MENELKEQTQKITPKETQNSISKSEAASQLGLVVPKNVSDLVSNTIAQYIERGLTLPTDYNVENAVISSYMIIQNDEKLKNCSRESIASTLIDMVTMGLNASKKQCYFIPYSGQLQLSPSYFGKITAIKRIRGVIDVVSDIIYEGTQYELSNDEYGNDEITITNPCPLGERKLEKIVGAWCKIVLDKSVWDKETYTTLMTMEQIEKSWNQGAMKGKSPAHINFRDEMSKKSVINRCCKNFVNSAKDNDVLIEAINRSIEVDYNKQSDKTNNKVVGEIKTIDFE